MPDLRLDADFPRHGVIAALKERRLWPPSNGANGYGNGQATDTFRSSPSDQGKLRFSRPKSAAWSIPKIFSDWPASARHLAGTKP